jgi:hypothetical protein
MLKLFVCYNLGMIINIDDLDFNDPDERRVILEHRKKKREENLALKKSVNNGYLKGQRGVRLYYDYDKIDFDNDMDNEDGFGRPIKTVFTKNLRREKLIAYLKYLNGRKVLIRDLAWKFAVTERTIQSDLKYLIEKGIITKQINLNKHGKQTKNSYIVKKVKEIDLPFDDTLLLAVFLVKQNNEYYVLTKTDYSPTNKRNNITEYGFELPFKKIKNEEKTDSYSLQLANRMFKKDMSAYYKGQVFTHIEKSKFEEIDNLGSVKNEYYKTKNIFTLFILENIITLKNYHWLKLSVAPRRLRKTSINKCLKHIKENILG